ncbi:MAG TPA: enoyl-CoA hydratase-related protein [Candidatus Dormibacteraeota bacterium]|nr:enoyl-CoA hydratase-related protein [Candidatus Dormibacteraeota bacterium]
MATGYEAIRLERRGAIGLVTLHRPERRNAYTGRMGVELHAAFAELEADDEIRAIVVTGAGRDFCVGADLERGGGTFNRIENFEDAARPPVETTTPPWEMATPIIAAINGSAVGVGLTLPMQWDIRIAAADAKLGFVFNRRGIIPEANSTWIVPRLVGVSRAMELLLTGRLFTGAEAAEIGLVSRAVERDQVLPAALEIAEDIAANTAPLSVAVTKRLVYEGLTEPDREAAQGRENAAFWWMGKQADAAEGITAFLEKRPPRWRQSKRTPVQALEEWEWSVWR